jgi:hypothetical protein
VPPHFHFISFISFAPDLNIEPYAIVDQCAFYMPWALLKVRPAEAQECFDAYNQYTTALKVGVLTQAMYTSLCTLCCLRQVSIIPAWCCAFLHLQNFERVCRAASRSPQVDEQDVLSALQQLDQAILELLDKVPPPYRA